MTLPESKPSSAKLTGLKKDLFYLRMQHATNQLDKLPIKSKIAKREDLQAQEVGE